MVTFDSIGPPVMGNTPVGGTEAYGVELSAAAQNAPVADASLPNTADTFATLPASSPLSAPPSSPVRPPTPKNTKRKLASKERNEVHFMTVHIVHTFSLSFQRADASSEPKKDSVSDPAGCPPARCPARGFKLAGASGEYPSSCSRSLEEATAKAQGDGHRSFPVARARQDERLYRLFRIYRGTRSPRCGINGCQEVRQ